MLVDSVLSVICSSPAGEGGEGGGGGGGDAGGGEAGGDDLRAAIESTQHELEERTGKYESELGQLRQQNQQNDQFRERLRQAIDPTAGQPPPDPFQQEIAENEAQLDHYLQAAVAAERAGKPIPLTINLAMQHFQGQIKLARERQNVQKELKELRQKTDRANDPSAQIDNVAYGHLDNFVINSLETIYGVDDSHSDQKAVQFEAITKLLGNEIKDLKKHEPQTWDRIRRSPEKLKKMVSHFVTQNMPPKARQIIEQQRLKDTPLTVKELQDAFTQAGGIEDPKERSQRRAEIRQMILSETFGRGKGYNQVG